MITKIKLNKIATYKEPVELTKLRKINFFFGSNGSGKTVLSKLIANPENCPTCKLEWENNAEIKRVVYNEDFVKKVFHESENFPGIFTIGEEAKEIEEQINKKNEEREKVKNERTGLDKTLQQKSDELEMMDSNFRELCWKKIYQKYQNEFNEVFKGYRKNKENFINRLLQEDLATTSELKEKEYLIKGYSLLFKEELKIFDEIGIISEDVLKQLKNLETNEILKTKIIGKKDIDIAHMIEKLHNHDWVRKGREYYERNYNEEINSYICPFCQQTTPEDFKKKLEEYFDETYENQIQELNNLIKDYSERKKELNQYLENLLSIQGNKYFDVKKEELKNQIEIIEKTLEKNILLIKGKTEKPSEVIEIESVLELLNKLNNVIVAINNEIKEHNKIVTNQKSEKDKLKSEIWKFFYNEIKFEIENYLKEKVNIERAIDKIDIKIKEKKAQITAIEREISKLEKKIKSVKPTIDAINKILDRFGFRGFKLRPSEDDKHYLIIREDGISAKETLSEGERNFILFLYFFHLIQGVLNPEENITESKVVIFDDPVSSLDSDVLFIVATLIKDILKKVKNDESNIKQVFILTHNVFFFKEVTYISSRETNNKRSDTMYYIIRKSNNVSSIESYEENPIKTSYQLLWDEVKKEDKDCICLQNAMRRIIEFYFKILGDLKEEELIKAFEDETDRKICRSLISWINVGSHDVFSDLDYTSKVEEAEKFKEVFRKIFEINGQLPHYEMMMGDNKDELAAT